MKIRVTIQSPTGDSIEEVADISRAGDLLNAVAATMDHYRMKNREVPLFDRSSIKIERV